jgi:hypothetical protein
MSLRRLKLSIYEVVTPRGEEEEEESTLLPLRIKILCLYFRPNSVVVRER